jgi:hypothetical protein
MSNLFCFYHLKPNIKKNAIKKGLDSSNKAEVLSNIDYLSKSEDKKTFDYV